MASGELYSYYAGFSPRFVSHAIQQLGIPKGSTILDPWNGAGTTTRVGSLRGYAVTGFDINPVMVLVAKAGLLTPSVKPSMIALARDIATHAATNADNLKPEDPLLSWFEKPGASWLRAVETSLRRILVPAAEQDCLVTAKSLAHVSSLAAFFYTALFRVVRSSTDRFRTSNPTWILRSRSRRIRYTPRTLEANFLSEVAALEKTIGTVSAAFDQVDARIDVADSTALPLEAKTVDAVVASPPYCTRIDYVVATQPELALLGGAATDVRDLRTRMIGTPTVSKESPNVDASWGATCNNFLSDVEQHPSKASATYYLKVFKSYFARMNASLRELSRVARAGSSVVLVVQDSYYKDLHNDLARMIAEMGAEHQLAFVSRTDFTTGNGLRAINTRSRAYRKSADVVETVLLLTKNAEEPMCK